MAGAQKQRKISAKAVMADLKAEMNDQQLMDKYGLSFEGLQDLFSKLMGANLVTQTYLDNRAMKQALAPPDKRKKTTCPYCGHEEEDKFVKCPRCNQDITEWLDTVELTKILTF